MLGAPEPQPGLGPGDGAQLASGRLWCIRSSSFGQRWNENKSLIIAALSDIRLIGHLSPRTLLLDTCPHSRRVKSIVSGCHQIPTVRIFALKASRYLPNLQEPIVFYSGAVSSAGLQQRGPSRYVI